jgi:hypothetical protein
MSEATHPHQVQVIIDVQITCNAPEGAPCRLWCDVCEERTQPDHDQHEKRDQGYCVRTDGWFDDGSMIPEQYSGGRHKVVSGPVELIWEGDYYSWRYES